MALTLYCSLLSIRLGDSLEKFLLYSIVLIYRVRSNAWNTGCVTAVPSSALGAVVEQAG